MLQGGLHEKAFLVLLDEGAGGVITAEAGFGERFSPIMEQLRQASLPECGRKALKRVDNRAIHCEHCNCGSCLKPDRDDLQAVSVAIRCSPTLFGFLVLHLPDGILVDMKELQLVTDLAESVSLALRQLFAAEEAKHRETELRQIEERYELALYASQAGLWDWNIKTGEMHTSPDHIEFLDYKGASANQGALNRVIHPDDKDRVLAILNEHLAGKTEEYRIEYRVKDRSGEWAWFLDRGRVVERNDKNMPVRMTGTHQNISIQKKKDEALAAIQQQLHETVDHERAFLQTVIDGAGDPVLAIDFEYNILLINQAAAQLFGKEQEPSAMLGQKCYQLFCGTDKPCVDSRFTCPVQEVQKKRRQSKLVHNPYHGNNINNTFELDVSPLLNSEGELFGIIEVSRDITDRLRIEKELRDSQSRLYRLAHHDTLTGLPNRLLFRDRFERVIAKARRNRNMVAILFLDLDRFKTINDTLGHDVGDELLVEVAARLRKQCRKSDTVARLGGDEFVFILDDITNRQDVSTVAAKVMDVLIPPVVAGGHEIAVSTSIGIAIFPGDSDDIDGVVKCADIALYKAKDVGRSNFQFYSTAVEK